MDFQESDIRAAVPLGKYFFTERYRKGVLETLNTVSPAGDVETGTVWVKILGTERTGPGTATVTFCSDLGWWHGQGEDKSRVASGRATLEQFTMKDVKSVDGTENWLTDIIRNSSGSGSSSVFTRQAEYVDQCKKWAQHKKPGT